MAKRKDITEWRDTVLEFMSTVKVDDKKIKIRKTAADVVHEIGYFLDHQMKDYPGSLSSAEQVSITITVLTYIQERLET